MPMPNALRAMCNQPFYYFGRGLQSFSFVSEDGTIVLKLFNNRYRRRLFWLTLLPFNKLWQGKVAIYQAKWQSAFQSYQIASTRLCKETGLLFFHPQKCHDCPTITLFDPLGSPHTVDLSQFAFALQKRAESSFGFFRKCAANGEKAKAREALLSLIALFKRKGELGIRDDDPLIRTNVGFLDGKAMQIDLGPFSQDPKAVDPDDQRKQIAKSMEGLRCFMERETPSLLPCWYEAINTL